MTRKHAALWAAGYLVLGAASAANGAAMVGTAGYWVQLTERAKAVAENTLAYQVELLSQKLQTVQQGLQSEPAQDSNLSRDDVKKLVADYLREQEARKAEEGVKVGTDLKLKGSCKDGINFGSDFSGRGGWGRDDRGFTCNVHGWVQLDGIMGLNPARR